MTPPLTWRDITLYVGIATILAAAVFEALLVAVIGALVAVVAIFAEVKQG